MSLVFTGGEGIEPPPKVLETPIIPVDQPPIIKARFAYANRDLFMKIYCTLKTSYIETYQSSYVSSYRKSSRPISTPQLNMLPCLHPEPINLVVFKGS